MPAPPRSPKASDDAAKKAVAVLRASVQKTLAEKADAQNTKKDGRATYEVIEGGNREGGIVRARTRDYMRGI